MASEPSHLFCETCARREWHLGGPELTFTEAQEYRVHQLKLRDYLGATLLEGRPCLSVCPERGLTVARKLKTQTRTRVLDLDELQAVEAMFDPTRQLSLF